MSKAAIRRVWNWIEATHRGHARRTRMLQGHVVYAHTPTCLREQVYAGKWNPRAGGSPRCLSRTIQIGRATSPRKWRETLHWTFGGKLLRNICESNFSLFVSNKWVFITFFKAYMSPATVNDVCFRNFEVIYLTTFWLNSEFVIIIIQWSGISM